MANPILNAASGAATVNYDNVQQVDFEAMKSDIGAEITGVKQAAADYKNAAATALSITNAATASTVSALDVKGASNAIVKRAAANADLKAQRDTLTAANAIGGQDRQLSLLGDLKAQGEEEAKLLAERKARFAQEHTGYSVIDLVINAVQDIKPNVALQSVKMQEQQTAQQLDYMSSATTQAAQTANLAKQTLTDAAIEANLNAMAADTKILQAQARLAGAAANTQGMAQLMSASTAALGAVKGEYDMQVEVAGQQVRMAEFQAQTESRQVALATNKLQLANLQATSEFTNKATQVAATQNVERDRMIEATAATYTENAMIGAAALGLPNPDPIALGMAVRGGSGKDAQERALHLATIGQLPGAPVGKNFGDAVFSYNELFPNGNIPETPMTNLMHHIIQRETEAHAQGTVNESGKRVPPKARNEAAQTEGLNNKAAEIMSVYASDITPGNPFESKPLQVLAPYLANKRIPFYDKVLAKMPSQSMDAAEMLQLAKNAISTKLITAEEATKGIADVYKFAVEHNNTSQGGFARVGLPNQESYMVTVRRDPSIRESIFGGLSGSVSSGIVGAFTPASFMLLKNTIGPSVSEGIKAAKGKFTAGEDIQAAAEDRFAGGKTLRVNMVDEVSVQNALTKIHMDKDVPPLPNSSNEGTSNGK